MFFPYFKWGPIVVVAAITLFFLTAFGASVAHADQLRVYWVNPIENTDGTTLAATEITQTRIEYGSCNGYNDFGMVIGNRIKTGSGQAVTIYNLEAGVTYCFRGYTTTTSESEASNVVSFTLPANVGPMPPVLRLTQ